MAVKLGVKLAAIALFALSIAGCGAGAGNSPDTAVTATPKKVAKSINSALIFSVAGSEVTVSITGKQGTPATDLPAQFVCANLAANGFAERNEASSTWKKGATSASARLPKSAANQDLCAISFTTLKKQAVAFFNEAAKRRYLADAGAAK